MLQLLYSCMCCGQQFLDAEYEFHSYLSSLPPILLAPPKTHPCCGSRHFYADEDDEKAPGPPVQDASTFPAVAVATPGPAPVLRRAGLEAQVLTYRRFLQLLRFRLRHAIDRLDPNA